MKMSAANLKDDLYRLVTPRSRYEPEEEKKISLWKSLRDSLSGIKKQKEDQQRYATIAGSIFGQWLQCHLRVVTPLMSPPIWRTEDCDRPKTY